MLAKTSEGHLIQIRTQSKSSLKISLDFSRPCPDRTQQMFQPRSIVGTLLSSFLKEHSAPEVPFQELCRGNKTFSFNLLAVLLPIQPIIVLAFMAAKTHY